jgi:photosystem II stability/assembly factor-like uncharacterized protein
MWQTQQVTPTSSDLRAVDFANLGVGVIGGKDGTIFSTDDAGNSWLQEDFTPPNRTGDIAVIRAMNLLLVAAGTDAATGKGRFWSSTDTVTWTTDPNPATVAPYTDVAMTSPGIGPQYAVTFACLRQDGTVDVNPPLPAAPFTGATGTWTNANGIFYLGNGTGYVCGDLGGAGQINKTIDGGSTFTTDTVPAVKTFRKIAVTPITTRPFACGDDNTNAGILVTRDSPTTPWYLVPSIPAGLPSFQAFHFPATESVGYVVGNSGTIYRVELTIDPVTLLPVWTWTDQNPGKLVTSENLYSVVFIDNDHGWIVGDKGTVLITSNGTASTGPWWTKISGGDATISWNALSFSDDGMRGIAVGNGAGNAAKIYRTTDSGQTWSKMTNPGGLTTQTLYGASVPRSSGLGTTAYICGDGGQLYRNTDVWGAGVWDNSTMTGLTGTDTYRAILFPNAGDKGVVVGNNGGTPLLLRTSDGKAWTAPTAGFTLPSASYNALSSNPTGTAVYASGGSNGKITVSTDLANGWMAWANISTSSGLPGTVTLPAVQSPEGATYTAMTAASDGNVYRLAKGGSWSHQTATPPPWSPAKPISLGFQGDMNGMVVTDAGGVYYTVDGGASWTVTYPHTKAVPRTIWMSPTVAGLGYVGCDSGVILRTASLGH